MLEFIYYFIVLVLDDDIDVMTSVLGVGAVTGVGSGSGDVVKGSHRCLHLGRSVPSSGIRLATAILGMHASYNRMAVRAHYPEV
jgi:hypothetical protein